MVSENRNWINAIILGGGLLLSGHAEETDLAHHQTNEQSVPSIIHTQERTNSDLALEEARALNETAAGLTEQEGTMKPNL